jgi:hypothetical protein
MTTLYLDAVSVPVRVHLDGPALRVAREGAADDRFPLRRLSRVLVRGPVSFEGESLVACLAAGVGLAFVDGAGARLGTCLPAAVPRDVTVFLLQDATEAGVAVGALDAWCRAEERRAVIGAVTALALRVPDLRRRTVERHVAARLDAVVPALGESLVMRAAALVDAALATFLVREGLGWSWQGGRDPALDVRAALGRALEPRLWPPLATLAGRLGALPPERRRDGRVQRRLAGWFEARWPALEAEAEAALARLRRLLREALA